MIKSEPIIGVSDVESSSKWYQNLLGCKSGHGGPTFEILQDEQDTFLCLHKWGEHAHPTLSNEEIEHGNGLILYLKVNRLDEIWQRAQDMNIEIEEPLQLNENSGKRQFCVRDPDQYYLMISEN
ncbi:MAG: glyoxalase [Flavobacteriales bacterium]|nr:glyoxalase [Flavobacteriales bacterium]